MLALLARAIVVVHPNFSRAQEAPATPGGDVTATEAAALPPIVVEAPSKPIKSGVKSKPAANGGWVRAERRRQLPRGGAGNAAYADGDGSPGIFTLGQIDLIGGSTITNEAMWTFNKNSVDQAVSILPGVTMHLTGGSRNERDI